MALAAAMLVLAMAKQLTDPGWPETDEQQRSLDALVSEPALLQHLVREVPLAQLAKGLTLVERTVP